MATSPEDFKLFQQAHKAYYNNQVSPLTDSEYDDLLVKLQGTEYREQVKQLVNGHLGDAGKVPHYPPMLSLGKATNTADVDKFISKLFQVTNSILVEPKYDGVALSIVIDQGGKVTCSTRGDGLHGEDVTALLQLYQVENLPTTPGFEYRGELVTTWANFNEANRKLNQRHQAGYTHPRNTVAGVLHSLESGKPTFSEPLLFCPYGCFKLDTKERVALPGDKLLTGAKLITKLGWVCSPCTSKEQVQKAITDFSVIKEQFAVPVDGVVLKPEYAQDQICYTKLGSTVHHPNHQLAYKYGDKQAVATVEQVTWQVGRTGTLTPVVIFTEPVTLEGCSISRVTGHNKRFLVNLGVKPGCHILVKRANQVIPKLVSVVQDDRVQGNGELVLPEVCPECGSPLQESEVNLTCTNENCLAKLAYLFDYAYSRAGLNIKGLTYETCYYLLCQGLLTNIFDIYTLDLDKALNGVTIGGKTFKSGSVKNLQQAVKASLENASPAQIITALSVPGFSTGKARQLLQTITLEQLANGTYTQNTFTSLTGVSSETALTLVAAFKERQPDLQAALQVGFKQLQPVAKVTSSPTRDMTRKQLVITGGCSPFKNRQEFTAWVEGTGKYLVASSVTGKTDIVIGDRSSSSTKMKKALTLPQVKIYETVGDFQRGERL